MIVATVRIHVDGAYETVHERVGAACARSGVVVHRCVKLPRLLEYVCTSHVPTGLRTLAEELVRGPHILKIEMCQPSRNRQH